MLKKLIAFSMATMMALSVGSVMTGAVDKEESQVGADSDNSVVGADVDSSKVGADTSISSSGSSQLIYFDFGSSWKNVKQIYCHLWEVGKDPFCSWQSSGEKCTRKTATKWSYDVSSFHLSSSKDYCVIFSADTGVQTFDQTIGTACIGDTARVTGNKIENAVDSNKKTDEAVWINNSSKFGPHFTITSVGHLVGDNLCPHETKQVLTADWLIAYYKSQYVKPLTVLNNIIKKLGLAASDKAKITSLVKSRGKSQGSAVLSYIEKNLINKANWPKVPSTEATENPNNKNTPTVTATKVVIETYTDKSGKVHSREKVVTYNVNKSGSGADGQETTVLYILGGLIIMSIGAMFVARKKYEE